MSQRKNKKADIDRFRIAFLQIGLIIALILVWIVFEIETPVSKAQTKTQCIDGVLLLDNLYENPEISLQVSPVATQQRMLINNNMQNGSVNSNRYKAASFPGGRQALEDYMHSTMNYPHIASLFRAQGKVYVKFLVSEKGQIKDARIIRGVDQELNTEAVRVINEMPLWDPALLDDSPVESWQILPVCFVLPEPILR